MKRLLLLGLLGSLSLAAMRKDVALGRSPLDDLPIDIRILVLPYIVDAPSIDETVKGIKKFYIASPDSRKSISINKAILAYLMQKFVLSRDKLQQVINNLSTFPVFKNHEMIQWIEQQKKRLDDEEELRLAAAMGNIKKVEELIKKRVNLNAKDRLGRNALMHALHNNKRRIALILIDHGTNVNLKDSFGITPLILASSLNDLDVMKALIRKEADPNIRGIQEFSGKNSLLAAADNTQAFPIYKEAIEILLKAGADTTIKDAEEKSVKDYINQNSLILDTQRSELLDLLKKYSQKK